MKKLDLNPLLEKLSEKRDKVMEFHKKHKPDCGRHNHQFDAFLDDPPDEWKRVQEMRKKNVPLVKGGQFREFNPLRDPRASEDIKG